MRRKVNNNFIFTMEAQLPKRKMMPRTWFFGFCLEQVNFPSPGRHMSIGMEMPAWHCSQCSSLHGVYLSLSPSQETCD